MRLRTPNVRFANRGATCSRTLALFSVVCVALFCASGCGYTVGNASQGSVRSVYVPIANSDDFRRGYEFQLTEAVLQKAYRNLRWT